MIRHLQFDIADQELPAAHQVRCGLTTPRALPCVERVDLALCVTRRAPDCRWYFLEHELGALGHRTRHSQRPRPVQRSRHGTGQRPDTQSHHLYLGAACRRAGVLDGFDDRAEQRKFMHGHSLTLSETVSCPQPSPLTALLMHILLLQGSP